MWDGSTMINEQLFTIPDFERWTVESPVSFLCIIWCEKYQAENKNQFIYKPPGWYGRRRPPEGKVILNWNDFDKSMQVLWFMMVLMTLYEFFEFQGTKVIFAKFDWSIIYWSFMYWRIMNPDKYLMNFLWIRTGSSTYRLNSQPNHEKSDMEMINFQCVVTWYIDHIHIWWFYEINIKESHLVSIKKK